MTLDLVVQRVGAALGRGHALFSPSPLEVGSSLAASGQSLENVGQRVGAQAQMLDARGAFGREFGAAAGRLGGRIAATGGADQLLGGAMGGAAGDDAAGRNQSGSVVNAAAGDTARTGPYANTPAGQQALLMALRDRVDDQRKVIAAYRARDAQYAAKIRALAYQQQRGGGMGGGLGQAFSGLGQQMRPGGGSSGGGGGGLSGLSGLGGLFKNAGNTNSAAPGTAGSSNPIGQLRGGKLLGELTPDSPVEDVASAIFHEAKRRGYSEEQAIAIGSAALQESGMRGRATHPNGLWVGIFQQDTSYAGRTNPNLNIAEFFNRLDRHGGPGSRDIWKSIFWLQQRPGDPSAEIAYARGRQAYLTEIQSQVNRSRALFRQLSGG